MFNIHASTKFIKSAGRNKYGDERMQNLPARIKRAVRLCNRPLNFSDFGHWQGPGKKPDCNLEERKTRITVLEIHWPTDESVKEWNDFLEKNKTTTGYLITGVTSLSLAVGGTFLLGAKVGSGLAPALGAWGADYIHDISMNELLSKVELPWATKGGYLSIKVTKKFRHGVQKWKNEYIVENFKERFNHKGELDGYRDYDRQKYKMDSDEEVNLFRIFMQGSSQKVVMDYGVPGSVKKYPYYIGK